MSLECQIVKIKKVPYNETDPVFTAWAKSYSANFYSTYTTVSSYSATWGSGGATSLSSLTANWQNTYNFFSVQSANNDSVYAVVNSNSATNWNYQGNDLKSLTANWQNTFINFNAQSANNDSVYSTVQSNSSLWIIDSTSDNQVRELTANWQNTYTNVYNNSANWSSSYTVISNQSANNVSVYNTVNSNSATTWNYQGNDVKSLTSNWQNTYNSFSNQSANNVSVYNNVNSNSANWSKGLTLFTEVSSVTGINSSRLVYALSATSSATNVDVAILPKGNGSFSSQIPNGTISGGNKRGQYAVDFQRIRINSNQVSSGSYSVILNGQNNTNSGVFSLILNGDNNANSGNYSSIINGRLHSNQGQYSTVINGVANSCYGNYVTIINGFENSITGNSYYSSILNGTNNYINNSFSTILGGSNNLVDSSGYATILNSANAVADRFGQVSKSNSKFHNNGDAQRTEFLLYGKSTNQINTELTLDNASLPLTLTSNSFQLCTIIVLGVDEDGNYSQFSRKMTIKNISGVYSLCHIESIGTDVSDAGNCVISVDNAKGIVLTCGSLLDNNTVWLASIIAVELHVPQPYTSVSILSLNNGVSNTTTDIDNLFS